MPPARTRARKGKSRAEELNCAANCTISRFRAVAGARGGPEMRASSVAHTRSGGARCPSIVDDKGRKRWTRVVYVIDLEPAACEDRRAPCGGDCPRKPIYVGETGFDAAERFARHKAGKGGSRWVHPTDGG